MFAAGVGVAGATDSWDSFAGGLTGAVGGWAIGSGINSAFKPSQINNNQAGFHSEPTNATADGNSNKALVVDKGKAASGDSITSDPGVLEEFKKAYADQLSTGNEQGGWITREPSSPGSIRNAPVQVERFPQGEGGTIKIPNTRPAWTVGEFHTHPPGGILKPSFPDYMAARMNPVLYGIKTYIVGEQGVISYTPADSMADLGTGTYKEVVKW
jgi:hypothetical protein